MKNNGRQVCGNYVLLKKNRMGVGVAIGAALGAALGAVTGNMAVSLAIGIAMGVAFAAIRQKKHK